MRVFAATRPVWMEVDLDALRSNYRELARLAGPEMRVVASVKANAYGHGVVPVARALAGEGVFAVATGSFADALAIRKAAVPVRVLLFGGGLPQAALECLRHDLVPTVSSMEAAEAVSAAADTPAPVYVKVDAGLGRLGVPVEEATAFVRAVSALPGVVVEGLYTHLPFVDVAGRDWAESRLPAFRAVVDGLARAGLPIPVTQALASAGVVCGLDGGANAVCPGHVLYGIPPAAPDLGDFSAFRPVLRAIKTRLVHVSRHPDERAAGIGGSQRLPAGSRSGVVPCGRYDGYRAARSGDAVMLVGGRRVRVRGLSLEHATLDLTGSDGARVGDEVVVLGRDGGEEITLADLAAWQEASPVDVLMNFDRRLPYRYLATA